MLINMVVRDINKRRVTFTVTGLVMLALGIAELTMEALSPVNTSLDFIQGFYLGTGAGLIIIGLFFIVYYGFMLKNPKRRKKAEIEAKDERNQFISMKSTQIASVVSLLIQYIALLVSGMVNMTAFFILLVVLAVQILMVITVWLIVRKIS